MKNLILFLIILFVMMLSSCSERRSGERTPIVKPTVIQDTNKLVEETYKIETLPFNLNVYVSDIVVDGCGYIIVSGRYGTIITHKANCHNHPRLQ